MIGSLRGILLEKTAQNLVVEVNGLGYEVQLPASDLALLPSIGQEVKLYTHFVVREDGQFLFGFLDKKSRSLFRSLIKISGVGPKMALAILAAMEPELFVHNILNNAYAALENIPGIGAKTAKRLVVELKDSIGIWSADLEISTNAIGTNDLQDALSALVALGYKPGEAQKALAKHQKQGLSSQELIRLALKEIE